uniref:BTB_2 domain-containing protein n=1 Tax=Parastrongyloides trichosuri TaxID=131310 RepID=A0A0N4ZBM7_PARTI
MNFPNEQIPEDEDKMCLRDLVGMNRIEYNERKNARDLDQSWTKLDYEQISRMRSRDMFCNIRTRNNNDDKMNNYNNARDDEDTIWYMTLTFPQNERIEEFNLGIFLERKGLTSFFIDYMGQSYYIRSPHKCIIEKIQTFFDKERLCGAIKLPFKVRQQMFPTFNVNF